MEVFHTESLSKREIDQILSVLDLGGVIGFPTDTAYGLGADPYNNEAVARIFRIKGREESKPILLLVDSVAMVERIARPTPRFYELANAFWPGPLTVILEAVPTLSPLVTAGTGTVGVRWPDAPFVQELLQRFGKAITATSANLSGMPSCLTAAEVRAQLEGRLELLVDGGELPARSGSTVIDLVVDPPMLVREGPVTYERLFEFFDGRLTRRHP